MIFFAAVAICDDIYFKTSEKSLASKERGAADKHMKLLFNFVTEAYIKDEIYFRVTTKQIQKQILKELH